MPDPTAADLDDAQAALSSLLEKCRKSLDGGALSPSRQTLMRRRIAALEIAVALIGREMGRRQPDD